MNALRQIRRIDTQSLTLEIPPAFWGQRVEIILLSLAEDHPRTKTSMYGCVHEYANPALIPQEDDAWANAVKEV